MKHKRMTIWAALALSLLCPFFLFPLLPFGAFLLATGLIASCALLSLARPALVEEGWQIALAGLLVGYAFLDKGFAYLGAPPLFVGDIVLLTGVVCATLTGSFPNLVRSAPLAFLALFMGHGALRTAPYLDQHGLLALRDAVIWGYGAFCFLIVGSLRKKRSAQRAVRAYSVLLPLLVLWAPTLLFLQESFPGFSPMVPGTDIPLIFVKPGDIGPHLGGAAAFLLLGLHRDRTISGVTNIMSRPIEGLLWLVWMIAFFVVGSGNRGALLSMLVAVVLAFILDPATRKLALVRCAAGALIVTAVALFNPQIDVGRARTVSVEQVGKNLASVFVSDWGDPADGTRQWRLSWWKQIWDYTVGGPLFWSGKGYGVNLAFDDGIQNSPDAPLRSPHNGHLTILARGGVPAFLLWVAFLAAFYATVLRQHAIDQSAGDTNSKLLAWVLAYGTAFLVSASFDVLLEGPQGGIWFWSIVGFALVLVKMGRVQADAGKARWPIHVGRFRLQR